MMMKTKLLSALVASVFLVGSLGVGAEAVAQAQEAKVSKASAKTLKAAQDAMKAKKYSEALSKLKEAQGIQGKTPYDEYLTNEMLGFIYSAQKQYGEAVKPLEANLGSPFMKPADQSKRVTQLITLNYQLKNYDKVVDLGQRAIKGGFADDETYTWIGQAYYLKGDQKSASKFVGDYVTKQIKAGKKPKEQTLLLVRDACAKSGDGPCQQTVFERLVTYYPKPEYWQNLVVSLYDDDKNRLNVYRLANEVDALKNPSDYTEYAQLAMEAGAPGEAQMILEKGLEKKVFVDQRTIDKNKRLLELAKKKVAENKTALPKLDGEAAASATGDKDFNVGVAYLGYKDYDKAAQALQRGLAKPGVPNPAEGHLLLGIAELGAGRKDDARKSFKAVKGNPRLEQLANLWILHSQAS